MRFFSALHRLHDLGKDIGTRVIDMYFVRERNSKRETKLINMLLFIKTTLWKVCWKNNCLPSTHTRPIKYLSYHSFTHSTCSIFLQTLFGKEAEKLEHANDDEKTYYIIEKDPLVNKFISVPKDKGSFNCATFTAGIIEGVLNDCGFVSAMQISNYPRCVYLEWKRAIWVHSTWQTKSGSWVLSCTEIIWFTFFLFADM